MTPASAAGLFVLVTGPIVVLMALLLFPRWRRFLLGAMVFTTCQVEKPFYQEIFFQFYRGPDRGYGVTLTDLLLFGFLMYTLLTAFAGSAAGGRPRLVIWPYNTGPFLLFIGICSVSMVTATDPLLASFSVWKLIRGFILYWVMVNQIRDKKDMMAVLDGFLAAVCFQGFLVFWAKYVTGSVVYRSHGSFNHPNTLAMYFNLLLGILLAYYLSHDVPGSRRPLYMMAIAGGSLCVVFAKSRAALFLLFALLVGVTLVSCFLRPTFRKLRLIAGGLIVFALLGAMATPRLMRRFERAPIQSERTREKFKVAAWQMASERPLGVGLNCYSHALGTTHYYWSVYDDKAMEADREEFRDTKAGQSRLGTAHHIYLLLAAEVGWVGLAAFLLWIGRFYLRNLSLFIRTKCETRRALYLGILGGTTALHLQGFLEWVMMQTQVFFVFQVVCALLISLARIHDEPRSDMGG